MAEMSALDALKRAAAICRAVATFYTGTEKLSALQAADSIDALAAQLPAEGEQVCNEWCGKEHCAPPRYCFYRAEGEQNAAGQVAEGDGYASRGPDPLAVADAQAPRPVPAAPEAPTPEK